MKWTNATDQLISQRHLTAKELAERLGITPHAVYQRRSKLGIKFWPNPKDANYPKSRWPRSYKMTRRWVLERDRWSCVYCGEAANQVDHVIPKNNGGSDLPSNLVAACARCNNLKGTSCGDCPKWRINANL
jgi:5-methylcytosine-specific restriction endonuclease McrA